MMDRMGNFVLTKSTKTTCKSTFLKDMQKFIHENGKYCKVKNYKKIHYSFIQGTENNKTCAAYKSTKVSIPFTAKLGIARQPYPHAIVISLKKCLSAPSGTSPKLALLLH